MKSTLHIQTLLRDEITVLYDCYFTPPLKIMNITEDKRGKDLQLMLMSSSPGILDEDMYEMKIDVNEHCSLQLHTQSYQRLFDMKKGANQLLEVFLGDGASFTFLPQPSVPHQNSIFKTRSKIYLENNCKLIWGEVLTCGRKLNNEVFKFSKYHSITEIFLQKKLILKENLLMQPLFINPNLMGQMGGYTHQASFIYCNVNTDMKLLSDELVDFITEQKEITFGVSTPASNILIVRILGYKAEQLFNILKSLASFISFPKSVLHAT